MSERSSFVLRDFRYGRRSSLAGLFELHWKSLCCKFLTKFEKGKADAENWGELYGHGGRLSHCDNALRAGARRFESCLSQWASSESFPDRDYLEEDKSAVNQLNPEEIARQAIPYRCHRLRGCIHDHVKCDHATQPPQCKRMAL